MEAESVRKVRDQVVAGLGTCMSGAFDFVVISASRRDTPLVTGGGPTLSRGAGARRRDGSPEKIGNCAEDRARLALGSY